MNKHFLFSLCIFFLYILGCKNSNSKKEVETKINQLYSYQESIYNKAADTNLFSRNLVEKIKTLQDITRADVERIKNSSSPTDKPILLEGSVFSSLYDGFSKYTIKEIVVKDDTAEATIEFEYSSTPKEIWTDKVSLINENGWKINNVLFNSKFTSDKNLHDRLSVKSADDIVYTTAVDKSGNELIMTFNNTQYTATLNFKGETIDLKGQPVGSGIWYKNNSFELRGKGNEIELTKDGKTIFRN